MTLVALHDPVTPELIVHIVGGVGAVVFGYVALLARKGAPVHRTAGTLFVASMLVRAILGGHLGLLMRRGGLVVGGALACYLVLTGWMTVRRRPGTIGLFERGAPLLGLAAAALCFDYGFRALGGHMQMFQGIPAPAYFAQALVAALATALDVRVLLRGGVAGPGRLARHLWRMCVACFEATSAFFIGQQMIMPKFVQGSPILLLLGMAPLLFMAAWLFLVFRKGSSARAAAQASAEGGLSPC